MAAGGTRAGLTAAPCSQITLPCHWQREAWAHFLEPFILFCFAELTLHFLKVSEAAWRELVFPDGIFSTTGNDRRRCFSCLMFHPVTDQEPSCASGLFCHGKMEINLLFRRKAPLFSLWRLALCLDEGTLPVLQNRRHQCFPWIAAALFWDGLSLFS